MSKTLKTEPNVMVHPMLPGDTDSPAFAPPIEDAMPTETVDPATEPLSEALTTPEPSLFDRLKAEAESEKLASEVEWNRVVALVATGTADESEVRDMLFASGKSVAELETAVARQKKINKLQALIADIEPANASQQEAQSAFNQLKADQKKQTEAMLAEFKRVRGILTTAMARSSRAQNARFDMTHIDGLPQFTPPPPPDVPTWSGKTFDERESERGSRRMVTAQ